MLRRISYRASSSSSSSLSRILFPSLPSPRSYSTLSRFIKSPSPLSPLSPLSPSLSTLLSSSLSPSSTRSSRSFRASVPFRSSHSDDHIQKPDQFISLTFVDMKGNRRTVQAKVGENILETATRHELPIPGTCGGGGPPLKDYGDGASCEFCHVYIQNEYTKFILRPDWVERERLSVVDALRENSRLCCQIPVTPDLDGMVVAIPDYPLEDM